jgi:hypothetical protein
MTIKQTLLAALSQYRGDDYERAKRAFAGMTPQQMQKQYGQSGRTCQQILDEYREHAENIEKACEWVERYAL